MKSNKKSNNKTTWIIGGIIFVALAAGAIYFGTKTTDNQFGKIVPKKPVEPTSSIQTRPTIPDTKAHPPKDKDMDLMETPPPILSPEPTNVESSVFLLPISNSKKLTKEDLINFSNLDLKRARNEIYARYGREFVSKDMSCYFDKQSWYKINPEYSEKLLSTLEVSNAVFILNYEKERQSPLVNKDSGCVL